MKIQHILLSWCLASASKLDRVLAEEADTIDLDETANGGNEESGGSHEDDQDSTEFLHFVAHNKTMTCTADEHASPFNNQIRGTNLGGWMVLEPWITPSLFYQFLGGNENTTAFDMYTFCEVLGPEEGNKQLRRHWETWVTEEIIEELYQSGAVNSLRLPLGDFQFIPYGPYRKCVMQLIVSPVCWS